MIRLSHVAFVHLTLGSSENGRAILLVCARAIPVPVRNTMEDNTEEVHTQDSTTANTTEDDTKDKYPYNVYNDERDVAFHVVVKIPSFSTKRVRIEGLRLDLKDTSNAAANSMLFDDVYMMLLRESHTLYQTGSHGFTRFGVGCLRFTCLEFLCPDERAAGLMEMLDTIKTSMEDKEKGLDTIKKSMQNQEEGLGINNKSTENREQII